MKFARVVIHKLLVSVKENAAQGKLSSQQQILNSMNDYTVSH